jgi:hypothetical protein
LRLSLKDGLAYNRGSLENRFSFGCGQFVYVTFSKTGDHYFDGANLLKTERLLEQLRYSVL